MAGIILTGLAAVVVAIGGFAGVVKLLEYLQSNAKAHSDVEGLLRDIAEMKERILRLESSLIKVEVENGELLAQNGELIRQNGVLLDEKKARENNGY